MEDLIVGTYYRPLPGGNIPVSRKAVAIAAQNAYWRLNDVEKIEKANLELQHLWESPEYDINEWGYWTKV